MDLGLTGKVALITGGTSGIGLAIAQRLAEEGCRIAICGRERGKLDEAVATLKSAEAKGFIADVCKPADVAALVDDTVKAFGRIDIVVSNAGTHIAGRIDGVATDDAAAAFPDQGRRPVGARAQRRAAHAPAGRRALHRHHRPDRQGAAGERHSRPPSSMRRSTPSSNRCRTSSRRTRSWSTPCARAGSRARSPTGSSSTTRSISAAASSSRSRNGAPRCRSAAGARRTTSPMRSRSSPRSAPAFICGTNIDVDGGHQRSIF